MCKRNGEYIFMHINLACWFSMGYHRGNDTNYSFAASRKKLMNSWFAGGESQWMQYLVQL